MEIEGVVENVSRITGIPVEKLTARYQVTGPSEAKLTSNVYEVAIRHYLNLKDEYTMRLFMVVQYGEETLHKELLFSSREVA